MGGLPRFSRRVVATSLVLEAVIIAHAVGVVSFGGPVVTLGLFLVVGALFWYIHRTAQASFVPPREGAAPVRIPNRLAKALVLAAVALGLIAGALTPRLAAMAAADGADVVHFSVFMTMALAVAAATVAMGLRGPLR
jgi:hypothetical protein